MAALPGDEILLRAHAEPLGKGLQTEAAHQSLSANIYADETVVAVGARETQVVGAHDLVALDVHDLAVEDLRAQTQLPVARLVGGDLVEGMAQDDRLLKGDDLFPRHVDGGPAVPRRNADSGDDGIFGVAGDD